MRKNNLLSQFKTTFTSFPWSCNTGNLAVADDGDFLGIGTQDADGIEAILQTPIRPMTVTALSIRVENNTTSGAEITTFTLRNDGVSVSIVVTIPVAVTGVFRQTGLDVFALSELLSILFNTDSVAGVVRVRGVNIEANING